MTSENHWENPRVFNINKERPHASATYYPDLAACTSGEGSSLYRSLDGQWRFHYSLCPKKNLLRAGLQTQIPTAFRRITWFGRGPQESMLDRKSGYAVGIYERDIDEFIHNYVRPQENANRSDVRWVRFTDENGRGVEIRSTSDHLFNFSAWPYTMTDLENADHIHELPRREAITVNIDYAQKGVGDLTSALMGMPEDAQLLAGDPCEFSFAIKAI